MAFYQTRINSLHYQAGTSVPPGLFLPEALYGLGVRIRLGLYHHRILKVHQLPVPVISVGNLTTGGTGKTPVVIALSQYLENEGFKVAVLSRGYGSKHRSQFHLADNPDYGDEPYLIQQHLQRGRVYVGANRVMTGQRVVDEFQPDVLVLDDGFQHLRLHRDINILLVDGELGFGNNHLLPAGPLREPLIEMYRADWILLTKQVTPAQRQNLQQQLDSLGIVQVHVGDCPFQPVDLWYGETRTSFPLATLKNKPKVLLSAIAQPQSFESMITQEMGGTILKHFIFPDHDLLTPKALIPLFKMMAAEPEAVFITTEKDWVKLEHRIPEALLGRVYVLRIQPVFDWQQVVAPICPELGAVHE